MSMIRLGGLVLAAWGMVAAAASEGRCQDIPTYALSDWAYYNNWTWIRIERGELERAEESVRLAIKAIEPFQATYCRLLARSYRDLSWVLYLEKRPAQAEPLGKWALTVYEQDARVSPDSLFQSLFTLALIERDLHKSKDAIPLLTRALKLQESTVGPADPGIADTLEVIAALHESEGQYSLAEPLFRRLIAIREKDRPELNLDLASAAEHYASVLTKLDRGAEAKTFLARAAAIRQAAADGGLLQKPKRTPPKLVATASRGR